MSAVGNYEVIKSSVTFQQNLGAVITPPAGKVALSFVFDHSGYYTVFYPSIDTDGKARIVSESGSTSNITINYTLVCAEMAT